ncbi:hypothetical protein ACGFJ7_35640 [Actinoplanes sp. NPDC048988]|uniref:hypothetical protein n=1 Tax=Actinoplanes sp. NPDC048988 TaxID=3363901 RepID=UPI0037155DD9
MDKIDRLRRRVAQTSDPYAAQDLGDLLWERFGEAAADEAVRVFALAMTLDAGPVPAALQTRVADAAADYAVGLLQRAIATPDPVAANLAADLWNRIANVLPHHGGFLSRLGVALRVQFERTGDRHRLELAVRAGETALLRADESDPDFPSYLCNVGVTLRLWYVHGGNHAELTRSVELLREALALLPIEHPERAAYLGALATSLCLRPEDRHGLSTAVRLARRAAAISAPDDIESLSNLAVTLLTSYRDSGDPAQLDEAAEVLTRAAASVPADHPERPAVFTNQAAVLRSRFEANGNHADLWLAVGAAGTALRSAARTDPDQALYRVNLALALLTRFETTGRARDLGQAVSLLRAAVASTAPGHADRAMRLSHLGLAVEMQVRTTGSRTDLDEAVSLLRAACEVGHGHPMWPMFRSNLGNVLQTRFDWLGAVEDLDAAIEALTDAVSVTSDEHPDRPMYLGNLGAARLARFRRYSDRSDVDAAVEAAQRALRLTPERHPARPGRLSNLGIALRARGRQTDLQEAITCCRTAIRAVTDNHPERPALLSNLAGALLDRQRHRGDRTDLDEAVSWLRQAVQLSPADHPARGVYQSNLGYALAAAGHPEAAANVCLAAADSPTATIVVRIRAAWHASELLATANPALAAVAGRTATQLLPLAVPRALARPDQEVVLSRLSGVALDAAALFLAVADDASGDAVESLETGRVVLLGQLRDGHPDLTRLRASRPDLAGRLAALTTVLEGR